MVVNSLRGQSPAMAVRPLLSLNVSVGLAIIGVFGAIFLVLNLIL